MNKACGRLNGLQTREWRVLSLGAWTLCLLLFAITSLTSGVSSAEELSLQKLVNPSTVISKDGHPVTFAIHAFIEFNSLQDAFPTLNRKRGDGSIRPLSMRRRGRASDAGCCMKPLRAGSSR